ncbi:hydroxylamine reductase [Fusobacterium nucleatum YWH7199]|uniref:Hydroxylamine reductase n=1 Tax=Fusobacterium nucleatum TaxID=851 RepID=A0A133NQU4_FUSNU|nr:MULTISPECIES: hydroxylamine reductase [Fusobacterium]KXA18673.1 hydroxylamine reductase [Fusobacterium nucleatum]MCL4576003.1 hydroxylamine reductase [Fusobacterium nucleatum YWH7056]MCL4580840.1 hydroxylamine reductase [Fusobacterium nucleatum YWH7199]MCL4583169.1 hydroxylamine reductase [Fusobacterium nucleatum YWH7054]MCL4591736.1 hydroxylamine reductase [Fusobacterium nucleatum YWH7053]
MDKMFCYQCQETAKGTGCTTLGVCGKTSETSGLQDLLLYTEKGVAAYSTIFRKEGKAKELIKNKVNRYLINSLFVTITNANFDDAAILDEIKAGLKLREELKALATDEEKKESEKYGADLVNWYYESDEDLIKFSENQSVVGVLRTENEDVRSLRELVMYGLKGMAAYAEHAFNLGKTSEEIFAFIEKALLGTMDNSLSADELVALVMETGEYGVKVMALLDEANTSALGTPEITKVKIGAGKRPGILISGHDLWDLKQLLEQSKDSGVDIYTHSEMLPGHGYPELKKYSHFYGNYGNAWWDQRKDFTNFNGPIVFTTNCIVPPLKNASYKDRVFTTNAAGFPGWKRIKVNADGTKDFSEVIELAKTCQPPVEVESGEIIVGFAHNQVLSLADKIVENIKSGAIKRFIVMSGCDGRMSQRHYYTEFAENLPKDTIILTSGCAKYKYNKLNLGDINGIPRVLDAGQCNDSYSWAVVALKLKEVFGLNDINELPIVFNIAWYEQKAVIVLLALLYLGVKNIHLGPTLPGFLSPNVAKVLVEKFGIAGITTVEEDLKKFGLYEGSALANNARA